MCDKILVLQLSKTVCTLLNYAVPLAELTHPQLEQKSQRNTEIKVKHTSLVSSLNTILRFKCCSSCQVRTQVSSIVDYLE